MKFGMNILLWTAHVEEKDHHLFPLIKEWGYDGVEILLGGGDAVYYKSLMKTIEDHGLECTTIAVASPEQNPISEEASVRKAAEEHLKWAIEMANIMGSPVLGGPFYAAHKVFSGKGPTEDELNRCADVISSCCGVAQKANVKLCAEALNRFEIYLLNTVDQTKKLISKVGHPSFAVHYDTHHAHIEENNVNEAILSGGSDIGHIHFSENHRGTLGTGLVDWKETVKALKEINYDGWIVSECFSTAVDGLREAACVHRDIFESEESCAREGIKFKKQLFGL